MKKSLFHAWLFGILVLICVGFIIKLTNITVDDKMFYLLMGIPAPVFLCSAIHIFSKQMMYRKTLHVSHRKLRIIRILCGIALLISVCLTAICIIA